MNKISDILNSLPEDEEDFGMSEFDKANQDPFQRAEPDDPRRCQATTAKGQCRFLALDGHKYCKMHGGVMPITSETRIYQLAKYQQRVGEMADHSALKSLREEIGILRMMLEQKLLLHNDPLALIANAGPISDLILKIERLVISCHKLETSLAKHLDQSDLLNLSSKLITAITDILDPTVHAVILTKLVDRIGQLFAETLQGGSEEPCDK